MPGTDLCPGCGKPLPAGVSQCPSWAEEPTRALLDGPEIVGHRLLRLLGQGGMGTVYLAEDTTLERQVAVKVISEKLAEHDEMYRRFLCEARAMAAVEHPNIVQVFSFGEVDGRPYLVMQYVAGQSLAQRLRQGGRHETHEALTVLDQVIAALSAAWRWRIVHRDLKPGNILLDDEGLVRVADFGLAKRLPLEGANELTQSGSLVGTPSHPALSTSLRLHAAICRDLRRLLALAHSTYRQCSWPARPSSSGSAPWLTVRLPARAPCWCMLLHRTAGGPTMAASHDNDTTVDVRQMELADLAPTFELGQRLFTAERWPTLYRTWDEYEVVSLYANERRNCLVADHGGQIVGFGLGSILEKRGEPWTYGYLLWVGVAPEMTRRGLGRRLIEALAVRFIEAGARMMLVDTEADNDAALGLFKRTGFGQEQPHFYLSRNLTAHPEYQRRRDEEG